MSGKLGRTVLEGVELLVRPLEMSGMAVTVVLGEQEMLVCNTPEKLADIIDARMGFARAQFVNLIKERMGIDVPKRS